VTTPDSTNPASASPTPPAAPAGSDKVGYELAPDAPASDKARAAKIEAPGLTVDFDEDADFDDVPGIPKPAAPKAKEPAPDGFVKTGWGSAQTIAALGVVATIGAAILAATLGTQPWLKAVVLSLYLTAIQTLAGIGAVVFAARMAEKTLGPLELAAARMLLAVAAARCFLPLAYNVPYTGRVLEGLSVIGTYLIISFVLFRLPRQHWFVMAASHAGLLIVLWLGSSIEFWANTVDPAVTRPPLP
jgi:hypothetical protein